MKTDNYKTRDGHGVWEIYTPRWPFWTRQNSVLKIASQGILLSAQLGMGTNRPALPVLED